MNRTVAAASLTILYALLPVCEALAQPRASPGRQQTKPSERDKEKEKEKEAAPNPDAPAPYDRDLFRLSEIMGALAFLRGLCAASDAKEWPSRMKALIEAEGATQGRRDRLAGAYNRGYRNYAITYRVCTPSATEATSRFLEEGERLSQSISSGFGG